MFSGDQGGTLKVWEANASGAQLLTSVKAHSKTITDIEVSPDGRTFSTAGYDGLLKVFSTKNFKELGSWPISAIGAYDGVSGKEASFAAYARDSKSIYVGGYNSKVEKINIKTGARTSVFEDEQYGLTCGELISNKNWLAFGLGGEVHFVDASTGRKMSMKLGSHGAYEDYVCEIGYFPNREWMTVWLVSGEVRFYDLGKKGRFVKSIKASKKKGSVRSGHAPKAGILAAGNSPVVSLFDIRSGRRKARLVKHSAKVDNIAFNQAEDLMASGGKGTEIILWADPPENPVADAGKTPPDPPSTGSGDIPELPEIPPSTGSGGSAGDTKKPPKPAEDDPPEVGDTEEELIEEEDLTVGKSFVLEHLKFDRSSYVLREDAKEELDKVVRIMKKHPEMRISLEGYTSNEGDAKGNLLLSQRRVRSARIYLSYAGIAEDRVETKGFGEDKPIADNSTPAGREQNRRIELRILEM